MCVFVCALQSASLGGGARGALSCVCVAMPCHVTTSPGHVTAYTAGLESSVTLVCQQGGVGKIGIILYACKLLASSLADMEVC